MPSAPPCSRPASSSRQKRRSGACWCWRTLACAGNPRSRPRSMPACSWSCRMRWHRRTGIRNPPSGSCLKATAHTPPSTANVRPCIPATSSSLPIWRGTTTATRPTRRCSGWTGSTFRSFNFSMPRSWNDWKRTPSRSASPKEIRLRATEPTCFRSITWRARLPRQFSITPMSARGRPSIGWPAPVSTTPATASRCAMPIPSPAITPCRPWRRSSSRCRRASGRTAIVPPMLPCSSPWRERAAHASATPRWNGGRRIFSWCRAGDLLCTKRTANACSSASPIARVQEKIGIWREARGNA